MKKFNLGYTFVTQKDIETRDGIIPKGTLAEINEISDNEYNIEGEIEPYKVIFNYEVVVYGSETTNASDWLTEQQIVDAITKTPKRIIVTVSGGVVENVYTDSEEEFELFIADYDNGAVSEELEKEMESMKLI